MSADRSRTDTCTDNVRTAYLFANFFVNFLIKLRHVAELYPPSPGVCAYALNAGWPPRWA